MINKGISRSYHYEKNAKLYKINDNSSNRVHCYENSAHFKYIDLFSRLVNLVQTLPSFRLGNNGVYFQENGCEVPNSIKANNETSKKKADLGKRNVISLKRKVFMNDYSTNCKNSVLVLKDERRKSNSSLSSIKTKPNITSGQIKDTTKNSHINLPELTMKVNNMKNNNNRLVLSRQSDWLMTVSKNKKQVSIRRNEFFNKSSLLTMNKTRRCNDLS